VVEPDLGAEIDRLGPTRFELTYTQHYSVNKMMVRDALIRLAISFVSAFSLAAQAEMIVISGGQNWLVNGRTVVRGQPLEAGSIITGTKAFDLVLSCPAGWLAYSCEKGPCRFPACSTEAEGAKILRSDPGAQTSEASVLAVSQAQLKSFILALFKREPKQPRLMIGRSGGDPNDAVLLQDDRGLHAAPALMRVLAGQYCFAFRGLPLEEGAPAQTFTLNWDRETDNEGVIPQTNLAAGAYQIEKGTPGADGKCVLDPEGAPAWVLIAGPSQIAGVRARWTENVEWLRQLEQSQASRGVVTTVRRAVLAFLAESVESSK
jgi:hypothetical protein